MRGRAGANVNQPSQRCALNVIPKTAGCGDKSSVTTLQWGAISSEFRSSVCILRIGSDESSCRRLRAREAAVQHEMGQQPALAAD